MSPREWLQWLSWLTASAKNVRVAGVCEGAMLYARPAGNKRFQPSYA